MSEISTNAVKEFLQHLAQTKTSAKKIANCEEELNKLVDFLSNKGKSLLSVDREDLVEYFKFLRNENKENGKETLFALQNFYLFAVDKNYLHHNPATNLSSPKAWQTMPKFLSSTDIDKLFAEPDPKSNIGIRDLAILHLLYVSGVRVSELIGIKLTDIDLDKGILIYLGKNNKERDITLGKAKDYLVEYLKSRKQLLGKKSSDLLFVNNYGDELTRQQFWSIIVEYGKKAGLGHVTPHMLRHTFATYLLEHSGDSALVKKSNSSEPLKPSQPAHVADERLKSVYQRFNPRAR